MCKRRDIGLSRPTLRQAFKLRPDSAEKLSCRTKDPPPRPSAIEIKRQPVHANFRIGLNFSELLYKRAAKKKNICECMQDTLYRALFHA